MNLSISSVILFSMSILIALLMYAGWSSMFSLGKMALIVSPPLFLTASRMLLAGVILLSFLAFKNRKAFQLTYKQFFSILALALFSIYLTNAFEFWSLQQMSAAKTCFIYSLSPFFSAIFSYLHFGEKMNRRKWLGMAIGIAGILPVLMTQKGSGELFFYLSWPELSMIAASICTIYGWILLRLIVKDSSVSPLMANGASMFIGGLFALAHSLIAEKWSPLPVASANLGSFAQGLLLMTLISNIICYNIYGFLLKRFTATFLSFLGVLSPIFASVSSWFFLREPFSPILFLSTGIVLFGVWLVYSAEIKQGYIQRQLPFTSSGGLEPTK